MFSEYVMSVLTSTAFVTVVLSLGMFLLRNVLVERLKKAIAYEYDVKLKNLEAELKLQNDKEVKKLESDLKKSTDSELKLLESSLKRSTDIEIKKLDDELKIKSETELAKLRNDLSVRLEILKIKIGPYAKEQFEIYNKLWVRLCDLKISMLKLWSQASESTFNEFSDKLNDTTIQLEQSALLIEDQHYNELTTILNGFSYYQMGKLYLIEYRRDTPPHQLDRLLIDQMINDNKDTRDRLLKFLPQMKNCMRQQISASI